VDKKRAIVTVLGADRVGIVAAISAVLAQNNVNIEDIAMTLMGEMFTMVMYVDITPVESDLLGLKHSLEEKGQELGLQVMIQREEVFRYMHRV